LVEAWQQFVGCCKFTQKLMVLAHRIWNGARQVACNWADNLENVVPHKGVDFYVHNSKAVIPGAAREGQPSKWRLQ
jgi:hypothetical protein